MAFLRTGGAADDGALLVVVGAAVMIANGCTARETPRASWSRPFMQPEKEGAATSTMMKNANDDLLHHRSVAVSGSVGIGGRGSATASARAACSGGDAVADCSSCGETTTALLLLPMRW